VVSNTLKWHWWRFNGYGYFWGMLSGLIPAIIFPLVFKETLELYLFPLFLIITTLGCIIGTYMGPPTNEATLIHFYKKTRPWGFWKPIQKKVLEQDPAFRKNNMFKMDMINIVIGTIAQTLLVIIPLYLILREYTSLWISLGIFALCGLLLKKFWWDKLDEQM
jgi:hypothetical protein